MDYYRKVHRQEAIVLMQQAIHLLQQQEEQNDPYAKLKNVTGITCVIFVMFCILYTVWDITAHLFNCIRNPTPNYLPSNPDVCSFQRIFIANNYCIKMLLLEHTEETNMLMSFLS